MLRSPGLSADQRAVLEKRGVLPPEELHRLASKTKRAVGAEGHKAACHSDVADADSAERVQAASLVGTALVAGATAP